MSNPIGTRILVNTAWEETSITEESLLRAAQAGNRVALGRLLVPHQASLTSLCRRMLGQDEDAEDAVQETFYRAIHALPRFRPEASLRTWLFRIAINVCLDGKKERSRLTPLETAPLERVASPSLETTSLGRLQLDQALAVLMPRSRVVLLLREEQGWSVSEIAATLHCTQRHVNNELSKARRLLKDWLQRQEQEGGAL